jgi:hypothetical protein
MKNKKSAGKKFVDLDTALQELARTLRPNANLPGCGNTNLSNTRFTAFYNCSCCSDIHDTCGPQPDGSNIPC